ncbi:hypothetical protein SAMN05444161_4586 [Rhizobiales bacterium GAS191]|nr:hypothetical protein SAMN05444161_4586 [Rhizobiales bacterium GAS191]
MPSDRRRRTLSKQRYGDRGFVLVTVLVFLVLLSSLAVRLLTDSLSASRSVNASTIVFREGLALDSALNRMNFALEHPTDPLLKAVRSDRNDARWRYDGFDIVITLEPESGKLDLNTADEALIESLARGLLDEDTSADLISRVGQWRQDGRRFELVEAALSPVNRLRGGVEKVRQAFTVFSGQRGFDPFSAPESLLRALPHLGSNVVDSILAARISRSLNARDLPPLIRQYAVPERPVYTIGAQLASDHDFARREAVIVVDPNSHRTQILLWRDVIKPLPLDTAVLPQ